MIVQNLLFKKKNLCKNKSINQNLSPHPHQK